MKILALHQGAELYGSDRSFLQCIEALKKGYPDTHIDIQVAADGPLIAHLERVSYSTKIVPLWIIRKANIAWLITFGLIRLLVNMIRFSQNFRHYDIIYINTCVVFDYILLSVLFRSKSIIHVREILPPTIFGHLI